jgi:hypothetical protein
MLATVLQLAALVGFPVAGGLGVTSTAGGLVAGVSLSVLLIGDALEKRGG